ncbi:MAG: outer membrane protein assembly factor BamD [Rhizobiaceae bacterium]|nr:outer membrane protein assembly factor BamD [Rhizobiaceae bacterium]
MNRFNSHKNNRSRSIVLNGLFVASLLFLAACTKTGESSSEYIDNIEPADVLYNQGLANLDAGDRKEARDKFEAIDKQHPYSEYSRKSLLMLTFMSYRSGQYGDSVSTGKRYVSLYPGSDDAAYAQYLVGMSYFRQIPDVTRDQNITAQAYTAMKAVTDNYPESEYVEDAKAKMRVSFDQIAGKQMLVGRYYQERREFLAAVNRFRTVVEDFQTTRHVEEALARLTESYYALGLVSEAQTATAILGLNFPDSQWYKDSYKLLQTGGLEPREDENSWLSKLFSTSRISKT